MAFESDQEYVYGIPDAGFIQLANRAFQEFFQNDGGLKTRSTAALVHVSEYRFLERPRLHRQIDPGVRCWSINFVVGPASEKRAFI